jgi:hypothetical protein
MAVNQSVDDVTERAADNHGGADFARKAELVVQNGTGEIRADNECQP